MIPTEVNEERRGDHLATMASVLETAAALRGLARVLFQHGEGARLYANGDQSALACLDAAALAFRQALAAAHDHADEWELDLGPGGGAA